MPTDQQLVSGQVEPAPLDYDVPPGAEILLKAVSAVFTDNSAAGDWLPCVTLISDSGHVVARAVDPAAKVTAGDDAEVSWFPGARRGSVAGSGSSLIAWGVIQSRTDITIPQLPDPGAQVTWDFTGGTFVEDGSGTFSFNPAVPTDLTFDAGAHTGWVVIQARAQSTTDMATVPYEWVDFNIHTTAAANPLGFPEDTFTVAYRRHANTGQLTAGISEYSAIYLGKFAANDGPHLIELSVENFGGNDLDMSHAALWAGIVGA